MPPKPTRSSTRASPARSSTPTRRCAPKPASCSATAAGSPASGATPSPATCRSCCCRSETPTNIDLVRQLVQAHAYWRLKGLAVDLVIWNEDRGGYRQVLQDQIMGLIAAGIEAHVMDRPGGIFVRRAEQISDEDRILLQSVARAIITDRRGSAGRPGQPARPARKSRVPRLVPARSHRAEAVAGRAAVARRCILGNGLGGFTADGTRVRHHARAGRDDAGAVGQRAGESEFRHRRSRRAGSPTRGARTPTSSASRRGTTIR